MEYKFNIELVTNLLNIIIYFDIPSLETRV